MSRLAAQILFLPRFGWSAVMSMVVLRGRVCGVKLNYHTPRKSSKRRQVWTAIVLWLIIAAFMTVLGYILYASWNDPISWK